MKVCLEQIFDGQVDPTYIIFLNMDEVYTHIGKIQNEDPLDVKRDMIDTYNNSYDSENYHCMIYEIKDLRVRREQFDRLITELEASV